MKSQILAINCVTLFLALCVQHNAVDGHQIATNTVAPSSIAAQSATDYQALEIINKSQLGILKLRGFKGQVTMPLAAKATTPISCVSSTRSLTTAAN